MKLTHWINGSLLPVREGWYFVQRPIFGIYCDESMKYWNGRTWCWKKKGAQLCSGVTRWKGLAEDPNKVKK
jgi:hypothetical protein